MTERDFRIELASQRYVRSLVAPAHWDRSAVLVTAIGIDYLGKIECWLP